MSILKNENLFFRSANHLDTLNLAQLHFDVSNETMVDLLPEDFLRSFTLESRVESWTKVFSQNHDLPTPKKVILAEDSLGIRGFSAFGSSREPVEVLKKVNCGEVYALYVSPQFHHRGIARELLLRSFTDLNHSGFSTAVLWCLVENPAAEFYKKLGGKIEYRRDRPFGPETREEFGFTWELEGAFGKKS